jgi:hypothetical protein
VFASGMSGSRMMAIGKSNFADSGAGALRVVSEGIDEDLDV